MDINIKPRIKDIYSETKNIEECVDYLLEEYGLSEISKGGIPIVDIVGDFGFKVYKDDLIPDGITACMFISSELGDRIGTSKAIVVNSRDTLERIRYALAYELARYIFAYNGDKEDFQEYLVIGMPNTDRLADEFATKLLMPEKDIKTRVEKNIEIGVDKIDNVSFIVDYYGVTYSLAQKRFENLSLE